MKKRSSQILLLVIFFPSLYTACLAEIVKGDFFIHDHADSVGVGFRYIYNAKKVILPNQKWTHLETKEIGCVQNLVTTSKMIRYKENKFLGLGIPLPITDQIAQVIVVPKNNKLLHAKYIYTVADFVQNWRHHEGDDC